MNPLMINLEEIFSRADKSPRKRHTLSPKSADYPGCRYMVNTLLPGTYIQPHRHNSLGNNEVWVVLSGVVTPIIFSNEGEIVNSYNVSSEEEVPLVEIPERTFHTLIVREVRSAILEVS